MIDWGAKFEQGLEWDDWLRRVQQLEREWHERYENAWLDEEQLGAPIEATRFVLCVVRDACVDSAGSVPFIARACEDAGEDIEIRIFEKDKHSDLMDQLLVDGKRSTPAIAVFDDNWSLIGRWGPRPVGARALFESLPEGLSDQEKDKRLNDWYEADQGREVLSEFLAVLRGAPPRARTRFSLPVYNEGED